MPLWKIAWRSIQHRSLASSLTALSMGLGVALVVAVIVIYGVLSQTFMRSAQGYDMVVGPPKGSPLETVLGAVFYSSQLSDTIPYEYFLKLTVGEYEPDVEVAIPIAIGEQVQNMPVVATTPKFFSDLKYLDKYNYRFQDGGRNMKAGGDFEAVLGYTAAKKADLKVGDQFKASRQPLIPSEEFPNPAEFTVVGILEPTGTPNDQAFFVNLEGFYIMYDHVFKDAIDNIFVRKSSDRGLEDGTEKLQHADGGNPTKTSETDKAAATETATNTTAKDRRVSAILVLTKEKEIDPTITTDKFGQTEVRIDSLSGQDVNNQTMSLGDRLVSNLDVQVASPTKEISRLFELIVGRIQIVLIILAVLVIIVAGIGMMVSIYNSMNERRQEIAIMRALGAKRGTVMSIILLESILLSLGGGLIGLLIGHGLLVFLGPIISSAVMVVVNPWHFQAQELILIPGLILLASIVGYLPAVVAYRTDVAQSLNP